VVSSGEIPELFARVDGSLLLVLLAASGARTARDVADFVAWASGNSLTERQGLVDELFVSGLLLETISDRWAVSWT
jgi:hypothetical protein